MNPRRLLGAVRLAAAPILLVSILAAPASAAGPGSGESYQSPSQALVDLMDAPPTPQSSLSPDRQWLLLMEYPALIPLAGWPNRNCA
jgi:hypothetical protein